MGLHDQRRNKTMSPAITPLIIKNVVHQKSIGVADAEVKKYIKAQTGLGKTATRNAFKAIMAANHSEVSDEEFEVTNLSDDEIEVSARHFGLKTLEELLDRCGIDKNEWNVKAFKPNSWPTNTKHHGVVIFSQVKAYLERKVTRRTKTTVEDLKKDLIKLSPIVKTKFPRPVSNGRLLEVCVPDLHLGKYGEKDEVGTEYNSKIAEEVFMNAIVQICDRAQKQGAVERIVFPIGNDFLNIDNKAKTTTAGTPQDCDISFSKMFRRGRILLTQAINYLSQIAPVDVVVCPGNHSQVSEFHLADCLECYFHNTEDVTVFNNFKTRKYYSFGQNLIVYTHGDKEKPDKLPLIAATEEPALWAQCKYREIRLGHLHHEIVKEHSGVKVRVVPSLSGNDAYHFERGYVENVRVAQGFVFDKETGLEAIIYSKPVEN